MFKKVAIVGTGLIGGSLALALKKSGIASRVVGVSRRKSSIEKAKKIGAIDDGSQGLGIIRGSDFVIFALPVKEIIRSAAKASRFLDRDCLVTDVGSTKKEIADNLKKRFPLYIGSHPLAGSEKRGINFADAGLFRDSLCILTPVKGSNRAAAAKLKKIWEQVGARVAFMKPEEHDKILSFVSHLPHAVSFTLMGLIPGKFLKFGSGGLKDVTRIASSDEEVWADIFLSNSRNILMAVELFDLDLKKFKSALKSKNRNRLTAFIRKAKEKRSRL